jgi:hypothetical protein
MKQNSLRTHLPQKIIILLTVTSIPNSQNNNFLHPSKFNTLACLVRLKKFFQIQEINTQLVHNKTKLILTNSSNDKLGFIRNFPSRLENKNNRCDLGL